MVFSDARLKPLSFCILSRAGNRIQGVGKMRLRKRLRIAWLVGSVVFWGFWLFTPTGMTYIGNSAGWLLLTGAFAMFDRGFLVVVIFIPR
jgi:hypothetical protein